MEFARCVLVECLLSKVAYKAIPKNRRYLKIHRQPRMFMNQKHSWVNWFKLVILWMCSWVVTWLNSAHIHHSSISAPLLLIKQAHCARQCAATIHQLPYPCCQTPWNSLENRGLPWTQRWTGNAQSQTMRQWHWCSPLRHKGWSGWVQRALAWKLSPCHHQFAEYWVN